MANLADNTNLDESLYSRQLYAIGKNTMTSIINAKVLIINCDPLAVEIMKNIILFGVGTITIADNNINISDKDYNNYYISDKDINKNRSDIVGYRLQELNPNVKINKYNGKISKKLLSKYNLVVFIDQLFNDNIFNLNEYCRKNNIKTIFASSRGFMGYIFCDFGNFITTDQTGEKNKTGYIISHNDNICITAKYHDFDVGSTFKLINQDNSNIYKVTKIISTTCFEINNNIDNISGEYEEVKQPKNIQFKSLRESIKDPEFNIIDFKDFDMPSKLHNINCKILQNQKDLLDMNDKLTSKICNAYDGQLVPVNSIIGGLVANMVISGVANKYTPIKQWLYYECTDICEPKQIKYKYNARYTNQVKVIGTELQQAINNYKLFIVGAGAIGCEHLKNFSMMGIGEQTITDMDTIEKSNLNRQFLFRNHDIGKHKSDIAAKQAKNMNPNIKINYKLNKVGQDTEDNIFNKNFYDNIDVIVNALDNIQARIYMDNQAINYKKPLLESGTLGLKGNVQVILPNITETYQASSDNSGDEIPMCTLKSFPYEISHCIQWAREQFENLFVIPFKTYKDLKDLQDQSRVKLSTKLNNMPYTEILDIKNHLEYIISEYVTESYNNLYVPFYTKHFYQDIKELITKYPKDHITEEGEKFWSGTKRFPKIIDFDSDNKCFLDSYESFNKIMNYIYKIDLTNQTNINSKQINIKQYNLGINIKDIDDASNKQLLINNIINFINTTDLKYNLVEFEKDDDTNGHIKFITSIANIRAMAYSINQVSEFEAKGIAGKIIPALATTTSIVSGLVAIELYKLISSKINNNQDNYKIDNFKNTFLTLGMFFMGSSEPGPCKVTRIGKLDISVWSTFKFKNTNTLQDIIDYFDNLNIVVDDILHNNNRIYTSNIENFENKKIKDIINQDNIVLYVTIYDKNNEEKLEVINVIIE